MAIGLARMFGIVLPMNFYSPYQAVNIIDFWKRWHITLSRFLRDYVYVPLGGNRKGTTRRYVNLMVTMMLGGLWHGAGWTFLLWGALHGAYLVINHGWHAIRRLLGHDLQHSTFWGRVLSRALTFSVVVVAWVLFRAKSLDAAVLMFKAMAGMNGIIWPVEFTTYFGSFASVLVEHGLQFSSLTYFSLSEISFISSLIVIVLFIPNTQQIMFEWRPALEIYRRQPTSCPYSWMTWRPNVVWGLICAILGVYSVFNLRKVSEFLYFQF